MHSLTLRVLDEHFLLDHDRNETDERGSISLMLLPKHWALFIGLSMATTTLAGLHSAQSRTTQTAKPAAPETHEVSKSPLAVTISVQPKPVDHNEAFDVTLCVTNTSSTIQNFAVWNCSWEEHWQTNNPLVGPARGTVCDANGVYVVELHPGEKYRKTLKMRLGYGQEKAPVSFQMGFTPYEVKPFKGDKDDYHHLTQWGKFDVPVPFKGKITYWSNIVTLN